MKKVSYFYATLILFIIVSTLHLSRIIFGLMIEIGGIYIPMWISWIVFMITGYLAYSAYRHIKN